MHDAGIREWHFAAVISRWTLNFVIKSNSSQQFGANLGCANNSIDLVLNESENGFVWHLVIYPLLISFCVEKQLHFFGANYIVRKSETSYFFVCYCLLCLFLIAIITQIFNVVSFSLSPSVAGYMCRFVIYGMHKATYPLEMIRWIYTFSLKHNSTICNNKNASQFLQCFLMISRCLPACHLVSCYVFFSLHISICGTRNAIEIRTRATNSFTPCSLKCMRFFWEEKHMKKRVCAYVMQYFINWKLIITSYDVSAVAIIMLFFFYFNRFSDSRGEFTFHNWQFTMRECLIKNNIYRKICIISFVQSKWYPFKMTLFHHPS